MPRRRRRGDPVAQAGWLYTDLAVVLMVVFLAFAAAQLVHEPAGASAPPAVTPTPAATPQATPVPEVAAPAPSAAAAVTPEPRATAAATAPPPSPIPAAVPMPPPTPAACTPQVQLAKQVVHADAGPNGAPSAEQLAAAFAPFAGQQAGIVLTFGHTLQVGRGQVLAGAVNATLRQTLPAMFTPLTVMETFDWIDSAAASKPGQVEFWVYFLSTTCG